MQHALISSFLILVSTLLFSQRNSVDTVFFDDFESIPLQNWAIVDNNNDNYTWDVYPGIGMNSSKSFSYVTNFAEQADDWLVSPAIFLEKDSVYRISFYYRAEDSEYPERMKVWLGLSTQISSFTTEIVYFDTISNVSFKKLTRSFSPSTDDFYYIAIQAISDAGMWALSIDDFSLLKLDCSSHIPQAINLGNDTTLCEGEEIILDAGNNWEIFFWDEISTNQTISVTSSGLYNIVATDSCLLSSYDNIEINFIENPVINLNSQTFLEHGETIILDAGNDGIQYFWSTGEFSQIIEINDVGVYSVTVTNANNCSSTDSVIVIWLDKNEKLFQDLSISQNHNTIIISGDYYDLIQVDIVGIQGEKIAKNVGRLPMKLNLSKKSKSIKILKVNRNGEIWSTKIP